MEQKPVDVWPKRTACTFDSTGDKRDIAIPELVIKIQKRTA
jgi:hypothetical protein